MHLDKRYSKTIKAQDFLKSEEGMTVYNELLKMIDDANYNTDSSFSPSAEGGVLLFIDKHMNYICTHLDMDANQYLSNLRLITKKR